MTKRHYHFRSEWQIAARPEQVWQALTDTPFSWVIWWPHLEKLDHVELHTDFVGSHFSVIWRAPIGYRLRVNFVVDDIQYPSQLRLQASGDLEGTAIWQFEQASNGTQVSIDWQVDTTKGWMKRYGFVLKPFFIVSHNLIMREGQLGLQHYLDKQKLSD